MSRSEWKSHVRAVIGGRRYTLRQAVTILRAMHREARRIGVVIA